MFQKREEELKGLINSLSVRKTDDLLCVIRLELKSGLNARVGTFSASLVKS